MGLPQDEVDRFRFFNRNSFELHGLILPT
jgi:hypothetical protein